MIRHKLTAQKQIFIGIVFISSVALMGVLRWGFEASGFLLLTPDASIEVYLIGVLASLLYLNKHWMEVLQSSFMSSPFEGALLAGRFALIQGVTFTMIYFLLRDIATSRAFLLWFMAIGFPFNTVLIIWLPTLLRRGFNRSDSELAILVGKGVIPYEIIDYTERCRHFGVNFRDYYGDPQKSETNFIRKGSLADLKSDALSSYPAVSRALFFGRNLNDSDYQSALDICHRLGIRSQIMLHEKELFGDQPHQIVVDGGSHFLTFSDEPLQNPLNRIFKRCIDIAFSLVMVMLLPLLILTVWLVQRRQSPGPLFFRQTRYGLNRKNFTILKFRTMDRSAGVESVQATVADPRVYPLGRFLRRMSLDEFPQFINVLRGEMSVIGPRPHLTVHDEMFEREIKAYRIRHFVKPGITGYAQIRGFRGEVTSPQDIHNRVRHDIYYISNWSPKLDLYIAFKTFIELVRPPESAF
jgi:exopolysaccharide biosynthesis polyprenyl glycosylphosphotransferase